MVGRQRFVCVQCGLKVSGQLLRDGRIVAYHRGPDTNDEPIPMVCADCAGRRAGMNENHN